MNFLGFEIRHTETLYDNHIKAERHIIWCGCKAYDKIVYSINKGLASHTDLNVQFYKAGKVNKSIELKL